MRRSTFDIVGWLVATLLLEGAGCATSSESAISRDRGPSVTTVTASDKPLHAAIAQEEARTGKVAVQTPSGVAMIDLVVGDGRSPRNSDEIVAHYVGWLPDGTKFESSHDRGRPGTFRVSDLVAGCAEGLVTMKVGGKRKVFVPAHLAYGTNRRSAGVPPDSPLVYEFELLEIR